MKRIRLWLRALFRPASVEQDLRDEFLHHLEMEVLKNIRQGMPEAEARRKALVDFGGVERFKEETRAARATRPIENLSADLRHSLRGIRRSPGFAGVVVLTLGVGIGANSSIFSVVNGVLINPLPYDQAENLVFINSYWRSESGYEFQDYAVGSPEFFDYTEQSHSLESVAAVSTEMVTLRDGDGDPEVVPAGWVSPGLFTVLRTPPLLGRVLTPEDGGPEPARVVVLSHDLWQRRFGADPAVLGRRIALGMEVSEDPLPAEIVGVMPEGFGYPRKNTQLWGAMPLDPARTWRGGHWFEMVGRLADGVSLEDAQAETENLMVRWEEVYPDHHVGHGLQMRSLLEEEVRSVKSVLILLLGSVGFVLLIVCANVASLLLARAEERQQEMGVRRALGAGSGRIIQQAITESFVFSALGGALGLIVAWVGVMGLVALDDGSIPRIEEIGVDLRVLGFTAALVLVTTILFGLAPALKETASRSPGALRDFGRRVTSSKRHIRFRSGLVTAEIALSVLLVMGAGLMVRSFQNLLSEDPGFDTGNLHLASFRLPAAEYSPEEAVTFFDLLLERTRNLPGVESATLVNRPPLLWKDQNGRFHIEGRPESPSGPLCCVGDPVSVGDGFFEALGLPPVRGRILQPGDHLPGAGLVGVVDQAAAARWWPGEDPIGQRVRIGSTDAPFMTVVGIVENITFDGPGEIWPHFFSPHNASVEIIPNMSLSTYLMVRSAPEVDGVMPWIREVVGGLDPTLAMAESYSMDRIMAEAVARPRFVTSVLSVFALAALGLGLIGVYGLMSYAVALRTQEIGIRRALGAGAGVVTWMVLRKGLVLCVAGLGAGLVGALLGGRVLTGFLHGVAPNDPIIILSVVAGVVALSTLASLIPASKASAVDPITTLKAE